MTTFCVHFPGNDRATVKRKSWTINSVTILAVVSHFNPYSSISHCFFTISHRSCGLLGLYNWISKITLGFPLFGLFVGKLIRFRAKMGGKIDFANSLQSKNSKQITYYILHIITCKWNYLQAASIINYHLLERT